MRRGLLWSVVGFLLAAGVLVPSGCGEDSSTSSLSKAEFTQKVNQMCKKEDEERKQAKLDKQKELGLEPGEIANAPQHKEIVAVTLAFYEGVTEKIEELAPDDESDQVEPILEAREEVAQVVRAAGPPAPSFAAIKAANESAAKYGLEECTI